MRVLVTGAAGLIGGELTGLLAERGHAVVALVRRGRTVKRNDGRVLPAQPWNGAPPGPGGVALLQGDVCQPGLGLAPAERAALAGGLDLMVHGAAATGFGLDPAVYRDVNLGGTAHVLALAEAGPNGPIPLLHVSTAYVCGERGGPILETELDVGQTFANGYEASKAEAERLVAAAGRRGVPVAVARPSIVVGASDSGAIGAFGNIYLLIKLLAEGRVRTLPARPDAGLDLVPVDHVAGGLLDIAERMDAAAGRTFHLVSGAPTALAEFAALAPDYPQFHIPRFVAPEAFDPASLPSPERRWHRQVIEPYASYFRRDPRFRADALHALTGRTCPPLGVPFLRRLVAYCAAAGFLVPPAAQRTSG